MNAQQIFDTVLTGLRAQGKASMGDEGCMYRGEDDCKCAVGMIIPDADYRYEMEGQSAPLVVTKFPQLFHLQGHAELLDALQDAHDQELSSGGMGAWEAAMKSVATQFGLTYTGAAQ